MGGGSRLLFLAAATLLFCAAATHADPLRVGKAVTANFAYAALDVGMAEGIFARQGLEIEKFDFAGGSKQQQALTAGSIDIALGGGTELAFIAKGAPELAIASIASTPAFMGLTVAADAPVHGIDDLKGKKIGVTGPASLTYWLVTELNRVKGWGNDGAIPVSLGGRTSLDTAAIKTHEVDGVVASTATGYELEEQKVGRLLIPISDYEEDIELFTMYASNAIIQQRPDAIRRFLKGWVESIAYMKSHRAETIAIACKVIGFSPAVEGREYDSLLSLMSADGRFNPKALDRLRTVFADLKAVDGPIDPAKFTTEEFLPKR